MAVNSRQCRQHLAQDSAIDTFAIDAAARRALPVHSPKGRTKQSIVEYIRQHAMPGDCLGNAFSCCLSNRCPRGAGSGCLVALQVSHCAVLASTTIKDVLPSFSLRKTTRQRAKGSRETEPLRSDQGHSEGRSKIVFPGPLKSPCYVVLRI